MEQRKKSKWFTVGSVMNPNPNGKGNRAYVKLGPYNAKELANALNGSKGVILSLQTRDEQIASLQKAMSEGKLSEDLATKKIESLEKYKDSVKYDLVLKIDQEG